MKQILAEEDLKSLAVYYCSQRETSVAKLKLYLKRKLTEQDLDEPLWIEKTLQYCIEKKLVDDRRYSEMLTREYIRQKRGKFDITRKLKQKGLELPDDEETQIQLSEDEELSRAIELCKKLLLRGNTFSELEPFKLRQKLLQRLVARGYSLNIGKKAVDVALKEQD